MNTIQLRQAQARVRRARRQMPLANARVVREQYSPASSLALAEASAELRCAIAHLRILETA